MLRGLALCTIAAVALAGCAASQGAATSALGAAPTTVATATPVPTIAVAAIVLATATTAASSSPAVVIPPTPLRQATPASVPTSTPAQATPTPMPTTTPRPGIDLARLLIGDGHVSTSPRAGYVFSCQTRFGGGGAQASGSWVHSDGTYDFTAKPTVDGAVTWPSSFMIQAQGARRVFTSNDLPNHPTGQFPIAPSDDAYQFDRNPNSIRSQNLSLDVPTNPVAASQPSCLPMGAIGIMITGSVLFNALDAGGRDAVAHEIQDGCQGHPEMQGEYHYHSLTTCVNDPSGKHSTLLGYALDGFGIYGRYGEDGKALTDADLDDCHGHTHAVEWDGKAVSIYHYHAASEYPYTLGCFKGTPATIRSR